MLPPYGPLGFMLALFPTLSFLSCLAIAACLTPTDPVISAAIVGKCFPIKDPSGVDLMERTILGP